MVIGSNHSIYKNKGILYEIFYILLQNMSKNVKKCQNKK